MPECLRLEFSSSSPVASRSSFASSPPMEVGSCLGFSGSTELEAGCAEEGLCGWAIAGGCTARVESSTANSDKRHRYFVLVVVIVIVHPLGWKPRLDATPCGRSRWPDDLLRLQGWRQPTFL